jgi:hypothetical protein
MEDGLNFHQRTYLGTLGLDDYPGEVQDAVFSGIYLGVITDGDGEVTRVYLTNKVHKFDIGARRYDFLLKSGVLEVVDEYEVIDEPGNYAKEYGLRKEIQEEFDRLSK